MNFSKTLMSFAAIAVTAVINSSAMAVQQGDWLVRTRIINISPNVSSGEITFMDGTPVAPPSGIDVDSAVTLDIDITYMFTNNFGVELLLDLTSAHDVNATGNLGTAIPGKIAEVTVLPPALIAQYHFMPQNNIRPYAGAGISYTFFMNEKTTDALTNGLGAGSSDLIVDDTFAFLVQAGVDVDISQNWYVNFDAKYFLMDTMATIRVDGTNTYQVDFDLDPMILGVGIGTRF